MLLLHAILLVLAICYTSYQVIFVSRFNPDRFTNANQQEREKSWFSPFGVGKRECLAREFTYGVAVVTMVTLLRKFKFHVVDETEAHNPVDENEAHNPVWGLSTHHHEEVLMRLSRR